jgi:1-aminocyclopropane-1-carboxylate deaminase/D-cysteine desulfhydrase-like pyridoxal-dependent ACC family enzyme
LAVGAKISNWSGELLGISIDKPLVELTNDVVAMLATETASHLGFHTTFSGDEIHANADYLGGGYGVMGSIERKAIQLFAQAEGILLDPVYTGRAAGALIDLIRMGVIGRQERILFWHTGGLPALFAPQYSRVLVTHV